jgi:hypothetical protein
MKIQLKQISLSAMFFLLVLGAANVFSQAPNPQDVINQLFSSLRNKVIADADKINQWKTEAENAARKTVSDFTDCPSPAAQNLYNDLKQKKQKSETVKSTAEQADKDAIAARDECKRKTGMNAQCDSAYNGLSFKATAAAATATINALNNAMNVLKNLKCSSGCNRTGKLIFPKAELVTTAAAAPQNPGQMVMATANVMSTVNSSISGTNYKMDIDYCSAWQPGYLHANWDAGNGEFSGEVRGGFPKCKETKKVPCCTEWDLAVVLPKLKSLNLIPPSIQFGEITISVPNKNINLITGVKTSNCSQPVKVCKRLQQTGLFINLTPNNSPLNISLANYTCAEWIDVGCSSPAFGLEPINGTASVPDITRTKFIWRDAKGATGEVIVDMTRGEFRGTCKKGCPTGVSVCPDPIIKKLADVLDWVCLEPRFVNVVANP